MSSEPDEKPKLAAWPADRFHPTYESFSEWLDGEAPIPTITPPAVKAANRPRYRQWKRRV